MLPLFIFDTTILNKLEDRHDRRVDLIHRTVLSMRTCLEHNGASMLVMHGEPVQVWREILDRFDVHAVTVNHDHEPYAIARDRTVADLLRSRGIELRSYKDISIFERGEVVKENGGPYTVFTPYMRKWKERFETRMLEPFPCEELTDRYWHAPALPCPTLEELRFEHTHLAMAEAQLLQPARASLVNDWVEIVRRQYPVKARDLDLAVFAGGHIEGYSVTAEVFANMRDARELARAAWEQIYTLGHAGVDTIMATSAQIEEAQPGQRETQG